MEKITEQFQELNGTTKQKMFSDLVNEAFEKVKAELAYERDEMFTVIVGENKVSQVIEADSINLDVNLINNIAGGYVPVATVERFGNEQDGITYVPLEILTWRIAGGCNVELIQEVNKLRQDFNIHKLADFVRHAGVELNKVVIEEVTDIAEVTGIEVETEEFIEEVTAEAEVDAGSYRVVQASVDLPNGKVGDIIETTNSIDCSQLDLLQDKRGVVCFNNTEYNVIHPGMLDIEANKNLGNLKTYNITTDYVMHSNVFESHKVFQTAMVDGVISFTYTSELGNLYYLKVGKTHSIDIDDIIMFMHSISIDLNTLTRTLTLEQIQFIEIVNQVHTMLLRVPARERGYSLEFYINGQDPTSDECFTSDGYRKPSKHSVIIPLSRMDSPLSDGIDLSLRTSDGMYKLTQFQNGQRKILHAYQDNKDYVEMFGKYIYLTSNGDAMLETSSSYIIMEAAMELVLATLNIDLSIKTEACHLVTHKGQRTLSHDFNQKRIEERLYNALYENIIHRVVDNMKIQK